MEQRRMSVTTLAGLIFGLILLLFFVSLNLGVIRLSPWEALQTLFGSGTNESNLTLFQFRLPRMVLALLIGGGLAVAGAVFQSVTQNDLADPGIIGINTGASLAVVTFLFLTGGTVEVLPFTSKVLLPVVAFAGAILAALLIYLFAWNRGISPLRLVLVGVAFNAILSALLIIFQLQMADKDFVKALVWLSGSIWTANWEYIFVTLPWFLLLLPLVFSRARSLNLIQLGDAVSKGLGLSVERERWLFLIIAAAITGAAVAVGGNIAFLGLVAPHMARKLVGARHQRYLPISALLGALFLLLADMIGRVIVMPSELPVGIVFSVLAAPYFLYLLMKSL
ncbi:FecCD family ABC transporter permease [Brevibacillus fulvus]|uniref:Iron complex transport system permease protein n=1 Tax=Brevibacillus fulvus TaxID=1125967 RepID=A0A938XTC7_9BACL|nr:iron ABC transporter permease [Brevibacillus fulvus]MBM7589702.1 iron complex transport system permease protein [Brevibacillus fulvus]